MTRQKAAHQDGVSPTNNDFSLWGPNVADGWASRFFFGLVLGVQGYRHEANGVFGHDTSSALAMGFTVGVSIIESRASYHLGRVERIKKNTIQYSTVQRNQYKGSIPSSY